VLGVVVRVLAVALVVLFVACGSPSLVPDSGSGGFIMGGGGGSQGGGGGGDADAGLLDAGLPDGGAVDAGTPDSGTLDSGTPDAGTLDAGSTDAGFDAGRPVTVAYVEDVHPMYEAAGCSRSGCHALMFSTPGLLLYMPNAWISYRDMINRPSLQVPGARMVVPFQPDASVLVIHEGTLISNDIIDAQQAQLVRDWVDQGAVWSRTGIDAGDESFDAGAPAATCSVAAQRGLPPLPSACLPRCARATWNAVIACRTQPNPSACQSAAIMADATAAIDVDLGLDVFSTNCNGCLNWQTNACLAASCPNETFARLRCASVAGAQCTAETNALLACVGASPGFAACRSAAEAACVAP
jgi:hypothetical protein